ncbi:3-dehydroquinate synthase [Kiritimatiella glycovorans]|uniref:3-dehydroquinate synthase n=1 Tax=Kiritimatiella glycovorans TaxID=1307763 RepID=A0A0G3EIZ8_9BACT|nr:3-dehydroquinate synthase [Kiritimatiella glycovorans]AKJ64154.1 3-dehydroquinate synthase [Kiritimatiella glycovorans]
MTRELSVELGERGYPIRIGPGLLENLGPEVAATGLKGRGLVLTDETVFRRYGERCVASLAGVCEPRVLSVPAGEKSKCRDTLFEVYDAMLEHGMDRGSFLVALGGGVVGDLGGYAAASYLRGIPFVQVPTTLLAMVDSSVGGKTGINLPQGKNLVGAFHQPRLVLADTETLKSLDARPFRAGMAEVVKYGVIRDRALFELLERSAKDFAAGVCPDMDLSGEEGSRLGEVIEQCCRIKADVVAEDEREGGLRAILNFGHTLAHALENSGGYSDWLHGEAVAVGMVYAARLSTQLHGLPAEEAGRIEGLLQALGLPVRTPGADWSVLRDIMGRDKKVRDGRVRFVLADRIGHAEPGFEAPGETLESVWREMAR